MEYFKKYGEFLNESILNEAIDKDNGYEKAPVPTKQDLTDSKLSKEKWTILRSSFKNPISNRRISLEVALKKGESSDATADDKKVYKIALSLLKNKHKQDRNEVKKETEVSKKTTPTENKEKKDKSLKKINTVKSETYTKDTSLSDKQFNEKNKDSINKPPIKTFKFKKIDGFANPKFPKKYIKTIEQMFNTNLNGKGKFGWSNFSNEPGGAGQISAQGGELLALMGATLNDADAKSFYEQLKAHAKSVKDSGKRPTVDESWVTAAENQRNITLKVLQKKFGKGTKVLATAWDTKNEVESMGLSDYQKNKGFSTDIYIKIQTPDGKEKLVEVSLKKDKNVNLLNSGTGQFKKWDKNAPDNIDATLYAKKQQSRNKDFIIKNKSKIIELSSKDKKFKDLLISKEVKINDIFTDDNISSITKKKIKVRDLNNIIYKSIELLAENKNAKAKSLIELSMKEHDEYTEAAYSAISKNKKLKEGLINDIRNEFPLKSIAEGEEIMALGGIVLDDTVLKNIFGTNDYTKIKDNLTVKTDKKTGKSYLSYEVENNKEYINIGDIIIYEDGKGYGGQFKFSLKLNSQFADRIKKSTGKLYESNFISYSSFLFEKNNS